jgi:hypothetical protein
VWTIERLLHPAFDWPAAWLPEYERIGRERVGMGRYATLITYRDHVLPLARSLLSGQAGPRIPHPRSPAEPRLPRPW